MGLIQTKEKFQPRRLKRHLKNRKKVLKLYPGAKTKSTLDDVKDPENRFYVVDGSGYRILKDEFAVNSKTVFDAWKETAAGLYVRNIIDVNTRRFDDEAVLKRFLQKIEKGELISAR